MSFHISVKIPGRIAGTKGSRLFAVAHGTMAITPLNLSQMLSQMRSESVSGGHSPAGKRQHKPLTITKEVDAASPLLLNAHWTGEVLQGVDLQITEPGSSHGRTPEQVYCTITLTNAQIAAYTRHVSPPPAPPRGGSRPDTSELERFGFIFQKITYTNVSKSKGATDNWIAGA
jgi:type VI secretion system secreted protein Hcp